jgi:glycosyltransferase domain-containing protein
MAGLDDELTVVIPTRNRPRHLRALLRFLRDNGMTCPAIVADSSDDEPAGQLKEAVGSLAELVHFPATVPVLEKMIAAVERVQTPFVVMLPDDDITLPHAIEASLAFLSKNPDYVAAQGHVLDFGIDGATFDIRGVRWFTPGVTDEGPVTRIYNLVRRYQPFLWAVFRRDAQLTALKAARPMPVIYFQEMTVMNAAVAQGKTARLPVIYTLRGVEESHDRLPVIDPFYAFLTDSEAFFRGYAAYKANLAATIRAIGGPTDLVAEISQLQLGDANPAVPVTLEHALNLIHALYYGAALDRGMINYAVQRMTGLDVPPIPVPAAGLPAMDLRPNDVRHDAGDRTYLWRREVLAAEPADEITISADEMTIVERQLQSYAVS